MNSDAWTNGLKARLDVIETVETPDEQTVVVTLSRPSNQVKIDEGEIIAGLAERLVDVVHHDLRDRRASRRGESRGSLVPPPNPVARLPRRVPHLVR
ncbi:hypothetical protein [uncultured Ornithinimicrobium sp.]|uniref:hypothetical protein n=1 Tax=uncultured Ornithinimicrobium sp. TaxID=259307 RepID=UPI002599E7C8|nr:hypothetical protein [uncultured Ornithinimicrobium sp.]